MACYVTRALSYDKGGNGKIYVLVAKNVYIIYYMYYIYIYIYSQVYQVPGNHLRWYGTYSLQILRCPLTTTGEFFNISWERRG